MWERCPRAQSPAGIFLCLAGTWQGVQGKAVPEVSHPCDTPAPLAHLGVTKAAGQGALGVFMANRRVGNEGCSVG